MKILAYGIAGGFVGLGLCGCEEPADISSGDAAGGVYPRDISRRRSGSGPGRSGPDGDHAVSQQAKLAAMKPAPPTAKGETKTTAGGVKYETLKEGTGPELKPGQKAEIHYEGKLENGTVFDSSRSAKTPSRLRSASPG